MGLTWIADIISMYVADNLFWKIFDVINASQGIFIFFIFLLKPRVFKSLKKNFIKNYPLESSDTGISNISASKKSGLSDSKDNNEMTEITSRRKSSADKGF